MFWHKTVAEIFFILLFILFCRCTNSDPGIRTSTINTSKIDHWRKNYDSLYNKYESANKTIFLQQAGLFADSVCLYEEQLLKDTSRRKAYIDLLFYRATDLNILENFIKSKELFENYFLLSREYNLLNPAYHAFSQITLGNIYSRYGDYKKALLLLDQALHYYSVAKKREPVASCLLNVAIAQKELGLYDTAVNTLQSILQLDSLGPERKGKAYIELADIKIRQHKISEARLDLVRARAFIDITPFNPVDQERAEIYSGIYQLHGDLLTAAGKPAEALVAYQSSLDAARIASSQNLRNREIGKTYIAMGKVFQLLQKKDSALICYSQALYTVADVDTADNFSLPRQKDIYAENTIAEALYARADCISSLGKGTETELEHVVNCYKLAFETGRKLLDGFSYDESRLQMVEQTRKQTEKAIATCYMLYQKNKNKQWAAAAFLFAEHNKAFVLAESVRRNIAASQYLKEDSLFQKQQALRASLASIEIALNRQKFSSVADTVLAQSLTVAKQRKEEELLIAENALHLKNPQYKSSLASEEKLTAEEIINKTIDPGDALIEYFTGDSATYLFTGEYGKAPGFYRLPPGLKSKADSFLYFFSGRDLIINDPGKYAAAANVLYNSIIGPYLNGGTSYLLVIPDGFISYIPFDALLTGSILSTNLSSFPFLVKKLQTSYAFSCKTLLMQAAGGKHAIDNSVTAFAPVFPNKERGKAPLLHSAEELRAIESSFPSGNFYTGNKATLDAFEKKSAGSGIIHLATHANAGSDAVMAGIEFFDSTLYLDRIYAKPIKAGLVVLSGCETGTGAVNKTEGLMSLARGFSYAGTRSVIASLWQTEDNSSATLFKAFYSNLSNYDFSTSLQKAKLSAIESSSVALTSPYYWSGYIYIGPRKENIISSSSSKLKWIAIVTSLALIIAYFSFRRKREYS